MVTINLTFNDSNLLTEGRIGHINRALSNDGFAIITAENPSGRQIDAHTNNVLNSDLCRDLENLGLYYVKVIGVYGENREHSLFVCNVNFATISDLAKKYNQESFIYSSCRESKVSLYKISKDGQEQYRKVSSCSRGNITYDPETSYTQYHNLCFSFVFSDNTSDYQCDEPEESNLEKAENLIKNIRACAKSID